MKFESILRIEHYGLIRVTGSECESFLQRQMTNDVGLATSGRFCLSAYLTPTGRVLANFLVLRHDPGFLLAASSSVAEAFANRLKMYVMRSDVNIEIASDLGIVGIIGEPIVAAMDKLGIKSAPQTAGDLASIGPLTLFRLPGTPPRTTIIGPKERLQELDPTPDRTRHWELCDIRAGIPLVESETAEAFTAQAINLDLIDAVSFSKGCFPGQEILARLHYRGKTNRRTVRGIVYGDHAPTPGMSVNSVEIVGSQRGTIVNSAPGPDGTAHEVLASIPLRFIGHDKLSLEDSAALTILPDGLPYALPEIT